VPFVVGVLALALFDRALALNWGRRAGAVVAAPAEVESESTDTVGVAALADTATWAGEEGALVGVAAVFTTCRWWTCVTARGAICCSSMAPPAVTTAAAAISVTT
jgi:hypothetical protein